jgi:DNA/RNA endonuclease YhcR with UshA esterase domain
VKEGTLIWICIAGSAIGIVSLYFLSFMLISLELSPGEVGQQHLGRRVSLSGTAQNVEFNRNGHIFFDLADDSGDVEVVIWEDRAEQLELSGLNMSRLRNGAVVEITGDVEYYRGRIQVVL